jgi:prolipoprotein diacylglyceryltransferase
MMGTIMSPFFPYIHIPNYKFGPFALEMFGLSVAMAVIIGATLARRRAEQLKLDFDLFIDSFFWVIPGGFILSHVVSTVLYYPERIAKDPLSLLYFWEGISSFGGFLGGLVVSFLYFRAKKVPLLTYMDVQAFGLIPGFMVGRLGCALAHDHPGMWLPSNIKTGMEIAVTYVKVNGRYVQKVIELPGWDSNATWIALGVFVVTAGLLASLISEKPLFGRTPLFVMVVAVPLFMAIHPMVPSLARTFGIPFPNKVTTDWNPRRSITYFNLQDIEPKFEKRVHQELELLFSPYVSKQTLRSSLFEGVAYEVTVPPKLVWGAFTYKAQLPHGQQKTYRINTRLAYDLGLMEFFYFVFFFTILWTLLQGKPRRCGFILSMWFISYAPVRFLLDLLRTGDLRYTNGLTPGNYMAILTFLIGVFIYFNRSKLVAGEYVAPHYRSESNEDNKK